MKISENELEIMRLLWEKSPQTATELQDSIKEKVR